MKAYNNKDKQNDIDNATKVLDKYSDF